MDIFSAQQMADTDRRSAASGVAVAELMEKAGAAVARFCLRQYPAAQRVVVLCGKGSNGGDGLVAARHLAAAGRAVRLLLAGERSDFKGDAGQALDAVRLKAGVEVLSAAAFWDEVGSRLLPERVDAALEGAGLLVDAIVGTGFKPPLHGVAAALRDRVAGLAVPVVAVDLPSGWDADGTGQSAEMASSETGADGAAESHSGAFRADAVVTFVAPKPAHVFGHLTPGKTFAPVVVAPIGTPGEALPEATELRWSGSAMALVQEPRSINGNKGRFGHVMVLGGSFGKSGAPAMASLAALRAGAGLVTAAIPREVLASVAAITPELMTVALPPAESGGLALDMLGAEPLKKLLTGISVVALGPGLGQEGTTPEFVRRFVETVELPMVIDADALNALAGRTKLLEEITSKAKAQGKPRTLVLTPHPGEMARLIGGTVKEVEADRPGLARRFATEHGVTLVLKGWRTLIAHPDGRLAVNTTGNPAMAKGGSGDILTGIVAAMLAQYKEGVAEAVEAAVFLHGLAGDFAALAQDEHTVLATDTVAHLWRGFQTRVTDPDGFTWIAGLAARDRARDPEAEHA